MRPRRSCCTTQVGKRTKRAPPVRCRQTRRSLHGSPDKGRSMVILRVAILGALALQCTFTAAATLKIDAGAQHACAIRQAGPLVCWGADDEGQLGNGLPLAAASA